MIAAAWGGGVNSTAMLVECAKRSIEVSITLFADTGSERPETYDYIETFREWMKCAGFPFEIVRANSKHASLEAECLTSKTLPSIAYGFKRCSLKWKRQPQDKFMNHFPKARETWTSGAKVTKLIGYDAGERRRAKILEDDKYGYRYPLIEWDMGRDECVQSIKDAGLPVPPKSACFFCPSSKQHEILSLAADHPDLMKRALALEANASDNLITVVGLGRSHAWKDIIEVDRRQMKLFTSPPEIPCGCYDDSDE